jgi:hypothetical protein
MGKAYWISRKRASLKAAQNAHGSEARLIHYDLAGRYSVKAASVEQAGLELADALPPRIYGASYPVWLKGTRDD